MGVEGPPGIITLESCAVKEKSEMRWLVFLSVATHSYDFSSETDGEDPTGSHELASVLDTHPNGRLHQHWAAGTSCVSVTTNTHHAPFQAVPRVATRSYGHMEWIHTFFHTPLPPCSAVLCPFHTRTGQLGLAV